MKENPNTPSFPHHLAQFQEVLVGIHLFLLPWIFSSQFVEHFVFPKLIFSKLILWVLFFCHLGLSHGYKRSPLQLGGLTFLYKCGLIYTLFHPLWARFPQVAFYEMIDLLPFFLFPPVLLSLLRNRGVLNRLIGSLFFGFTTQTLYGFTQIQGWNLLIPGGEILFQNGDTTFGNRNYYGAYLVGVIFPFLSYFQSYLFTLSPGIKGDLWGLEYKKVRMVIFWVMGFFLFLCASTLIGLKSRGVHLALISGGIFYAFGLFIQVLSGSLKHKGGQLPLTAGAFFIGLFLFSGTPFPGNPVSQFLWEKWEKTFIADIYDPTTSNTLERLSFLKSVGKVIQESSLPTLLLGNGLGFFKMGISEIVENGMTLEAMERLPTVIFRQLHNDWFQLFLEFGSIGFLLILLLLGKLFFSSFRFFFQGCTVNRPQFLKDSLKILGFSSGMISLSVLALVDFSFHQVVPGYLFIFYLSLLTGLSQNEFFHSKPPHDSLIPPNDLEGEGSPTFRSLPFILPSLLFGLMFVREFKIVLSDKWVAQVTQELPMMNSEGYPTEKLSDMRTLLECALTYDSLPGDRWFYLGILQLKFLGIDKILEQTEFNSEELNKGWSKEDLKEIQNAYSCFSEASRNANFSGWVPYFLPFIHQSYLAGFLGDEKLEEKKLFQGLRGALGPVRLRFYLGLARFYYKTGKKELSEQWVDRVLKRDPAESGSLLLKCFFLQSRGEWKNLMDLLDQMEKLNLRVGPQPVLQSYEFHFLRARGLFELGQVSKAFAALSVAEKFSKPNHKTLLEKTKSEFSKKLEKEFLPKGD